MNEIFVGIAGAKAEQCRAVMAEAAGKAVWPSRLTFGVCPTDTAEPERLFQAAGAAACRVMPGEGLPLKEAWRTAYGLYGGQRYAMQCTPDAFFLKGWDQKLLTAFALIREDRPLLTGYLSPEGIPQAVAMDGFTEDGRVIFVPGTKVLYTPNPLPTFLLSPDFVFGTGEWMTTARDRGWDGTSVFSLSIGSFEAGFRAFVPHLPVLGRNLSFSFPPEKPEGEAGLAAFEEFSGISFARREAEVKSRLGLGTEDGRYPVQLPLTEGARQRLRRRREEEGPRVMLATALGTQPMRLPLAVQLKLLENLAELRRLPLCCYCPPEMEARLRSFLPNTYARGEKEGAAYDNEAFILTAKPYFISQAAQQFPHYSHYGWIDMAYLSHPIYRDAVFLWDALADERIHLATVDGKPDTSLILMPRSKVGWLLAMASVLKTDPSRGDTGMFECLKDTYPDMFTLHPMEKKHTLLSLCQPLLNGGTLHDA